MKLVAYDERVGYPTLIEISREKPTNGKGIMNKPPTSNTPLHSYGSHYIVVII